MNILRVVTNGLVGLVLVGLYVASYSGLQHHRRGLPDAGERSARRSTCPSRLNS